MEELDVGGRRASCGDDARQPVAQMYAPIRRQILPQSRAAHEGYGEAQDGDVTAIHCGPVMRFRRGASVTASEYDGPADRAVQSGTELIDISRYTLRVERRYVKAMVTVAWLLVVGAAGLTSSPMSGYAWGVVAVLAVLPPYMMIRIWNDPPQTMSESIRAMTR